MWDKLSMKEKAAFIRTAVKNGIYNRADIVDRYNKFAMGGDTDSVEDIVEKVNNSEANFVSRLKDPNRRYIKDWASSGIATHKLGVGTDEHGNHYIYPEVQEIDGELVDFTRPPYLPYAGMISAEERGDTVRVPSIEQGVRFTENYKKYYPKGNTFARGGHIYDGLTEESQQMVDGITGAAVSVRQMALDRSRRATSPNTNFTHAMDLPAYSSYPASIAPGLFRIDPHTCLNTVTAFYDPKNTVANNANFWANPGDYGYQQISQEEAKPGDIIVLSDKDNYPRHAVMFDSVAEKEMQKYGYPIHKGDTLVNYSNGGRGKDDYRLKATLKRFDDPSSSGGDFSGERRYFKCIGL